MVSCADALAAGAYEEALETTLAWNAAVMQGRNGAPWVRKEGQRLDVRYRGAEQLLPQADELPTLWRNSYFVESLKRIASQIGHPGP